MPLTLYLETQVRQHMIRHIVFQDTFVFVGQFARSDTLVCFNLDITLLDFRVNQFVVGLQCVRFCPFVPDIPMRPCHHFIKSSSNSMKLFNKTFVSQYR